MTTDPIPVIRGSALTRTFGDGAAAVTAVSEVDIEVQRGEFVAVMGPSGCGKSTLLHLLAGLDPPTSGRVMVDGRDLADMDDDTLTLLRRRRIGFVFQAFNLLDVLTARENVALPLELDGRRPADADARAVAVLERVGLSDRLDHTPRDLSGGEQQRVALARALVMEPLVLMADEPTGNLDTATGQAITDLLRSLVDDAGQTVLMVTHNPRHASSADRILHMRDGRLVDEQRMESPRAAEALIAELQG
ncbi:MAG: ABC transporter ATP-binding protein [Phycisphaerales bacterium]|nr:MAG: ABC transporter ATP-binding protein [Phycisphaerales bacterium]